MYRVNMRSRLIYRGLGSWSKHKNSSGIPIHYSGMMTHVFVGSKRKVYVHTDA